MQNLRARFARSPDRRTSWRTLCLIVILAISAAAPSLLAQSRVGKDSTTRTKRYRQDLAYGAALGLAWAGVDQLREDPPEWGKGWRGYGRRAASNVGEFVIQETVTDVVAAVMNRPLDYQRCRCSHLSRRIGWALQAAVTDPMPNDTHPIAVPRILGAYAGSFAQASWRPDTPSGRTRTALVNGTVSLLIGAAINVYYEIR
jgi:hypothetical protein